MGAVLREQNALPYENWIMVGLTAMPDVDNVGAGRAAKGANLVIRTKKECGKGIVKTWSIHYSLLLFRLPQKE